MKINNVIPFFTAFLLILMGCTQDEVIKEDTSVGGKEKISVTVTQGGAITRISHEDDGANGLILKWTANDAFKLYGTTTEVFTTAGPTDGDGKIATFTGNAVEDALHAFFPASKAEKRWEDCHFNVIGQVIDANAPFAHLSGYNFMTAQTTASGTEISEISFKHKIAVLKFEVTLPDGIVPKYITLSTQDDAGIAISQKASDESNITTAKQLTAAISGVSSEKFTAYMAILPSTLKEKLALAVTGDDGMVYSYTVSFNGDFPYEAGKVYNSELTFGGIEGGYGTAAIFDNNVIGNTWDQSDNKGSTKDNPYLIESAGHLKYLIEQVEAGERYLDKFFKLTTDIKVTADTWTPIGISSTKPFRGNFDGGGHTISGALKGSFSNDLQNFGFFGYLTTTSSMLIENIHIAANITWSFAYPEGTIITHFGVGGVIGNGPTQEITVHNCTMSGEMKISDGNSNYGNLCIGGIIGHSGAHIQNCSSIGKSDVSCKGSSLWIGGIIGRDGFLSSEYKHCINTSSIILSNPERSNTIYAVSVGGIGGYIAGKVLGCCNQGSITGHSISPVDVGGITGYSEWAKYHLNRNLTTDFNVTSEETVKLGYLIGRINSATIYSCNESVGEQSQWLGSNPAWTPTTDDESAH
ncbi:fimbrillin family protein [Bacteroides cellulosilyticus]|jgi:hypothetical protein|uniref:Fimbrillin family protein n=1 Tax=Bacteroides cellulosilyticus TaxID=246787 RepID=A0A5M6A629_9BACE|nr:fimbrillin family protein [Bacteroides cellulosilyticus]KAA5404830.1 fimbrillin family protein [Bacteroides cellulosilyticus]RYU14377.1 hypothetical protein EAJ01_20355 [Bacteroides cellulosilyticus]